MMSKRNVFVMGAEPFNFARLQSIPAAHECNFLPLFTFEQVQGAQRYPLEQLLTLAGEILGSFPETIDAIVGYWDLPVSAAVPVLCERFNLPAPPLSSVIACEHKLWARRIQHRAAPECVPKFVDVNPFAVSDGASVGLDYPFWLKPVKSFQSHLGFRVSNDAELGFALDRIRAGIARMAEPFNRLLQRVTLPMELAHVDGYHCVAEQLVAGRQCTLEGYVLDGEVCAYGLIDSVRCGALSSFARYEYPSLLPAPVQRRIVDLTARLVTALGLDHTAFNAEFFYDESADKLWLIEINPRISQSHAELFERVDGVSNHEVAVDVALGRQPRLSPGAGRFRCAAKCFVRSFRDGIVTRAPTRRQVRRVERSMPGTIIRPLVHEGTRLGMLVDEDSYSYTLALVYLGADCREELMARYERVVAALPFEVAPEPTVPAAPVG